MTNKEFQKLLSKYPDSMPIKFMPHHERGANFNHTVMDFAEENILQSSEGAWVDDSADPETWDTEDGKIRHKGKKYLLLNPIIT